MKKIKEITYCRPKSCCPIFSLYKDNEDLWLEIVDDFGGKVKILADKNKLIETIEKIFKNQ